MHNVISLVLGGGRGTRLYPLTKYRSKPAVPLAGKYRLIDIPLSNCINSGLNRMYVLTQFLSVSLHRHIRQTYRFDAFNGGFVELLAAQQVTGDAKQDWYQGTADAVRKQLRYLLQPGIDYRPPRSDPSDIDRVRGECAMYRVRLLGPVVHESALPYRPEVLALAARNAPSRHGKIVSVDEVLHAAWAGQAKGRVALHYGARQWQHVAVLQEVLRVADRLLGVENEPESRIARAA